MRKVAEAHRGNRHSDAAKCRIGESLRRAYSEGRRSVQQLLVPNLWELKLLAVAQEFGFWFTGDGSHQVEGRKPDFWDGGRRVIELYGEYWHEGHDPKDRIGWFAERGYRCLVVWGKELRDMEGVRQRIKGLMHD